jgi:hypothetical protein
MITVPSLGAMLAVIGVALLAVVVLSAIAGLLFTRGGARAGSAQPSGGTPAPQAPAPQPAAPAVPGQRTREAAGAR